MSVKIAPESYMTNIHDCTSYGYLTGGFMTHDKKRLLSIGEAAKALK